MAMTGGPPATGIVTPEAVLLEFDTAGVGSRTVAELIDVVVQLVAVFVLLMIGVALGGAVGQETVTTVIALVLGLLLLVGYPVAMETLWNGRTLGKAALGLRVVTREGAPERFRHAAIRAMIGLIEIWALLGLPAVIAIIISRRDQRIGDLVAGTYVLGQRAGRRSSSPVTFSVPWNWESYAQSLDVGALTSEQYGVIRAFLLRSGELADGGRWQVAMELAEATANRMRIPPPPGVHPETFLLCVATAYQHRSGATGR